MTWPALTPTEFWFLCGFTAVALIAAAGGCIWLIRWAFRGWNAHTDKSIARHVEAAAEICLYCRGYQWTADCTCPKRCTAMTCMAPAEAGRG